MDPIQPRSLTPGCLFYLNSSFNCFLVKKIWSWHVFIARSQGLLWITLLNFCCCIFSIFLLFLCVTTSILDDFLVFWQRLGGSFCLFRFLFILWLHLILMLGRLYFHDIFLWPVDMRHNGIFISEFPWKWRQCVSETSE